MAIMFFHNSFQKKKKKKRSNSKNLSKLFLSLTSEHTIVCMGWASEELCCV